MKKNYLFKAVIFFSFVFSVNYSYGQIYNADFSNDGDGFADHTTSSPPTTGSSSVGPFGSAGNQWSLSYDTAPGTDGSANSFSVSGGALVSDDWGGQGIFESQSIDLTSINKIDISALSSNSGANDDTFIYFYILDGGSRVSTSNINSNNGDDVNYSITSLDVSGNTSIVVGFEFSENGGGDGYTTTSFTVTDASGDGSPGITLGAVSNNTDEDGTTASFTVVLDTQPTTNVVVTVLSDDNGEVTVSPGALTFTNANWDTPQTVIATGQDDGLIDGDQDVTITISVDDGSSDNNYDSLDDITTTITNKDNEVGLQINSVNTNFVIDFDNTVSPVNNGQFDGSGFTSTTTSGQLDSDAWKTTGMSDGDTFFGDTNTSGDYSKGTSSGGVNSGGFYAFEVSSGNFSLGFQPTGSDFTPGTITLRTQNQTGATISSVYLSYILYILNNEDRFNTLNFEYSTDDTTYTPVSALDFTSTETADSSPVWEANNRSLILSGLSITNEAFFYLRWSSNNAGGSGGQDEFSIDDITVNFNPTITTWNGTGTVWTTPGNWDNGVPTSSSTASIPDLASSPIISGSTGAEVNNLIITEPDGVTINSGGTLRISGTSSGTVTYKRNLTAIAGDAEGWHLVASPVSGETYNNAYADAESLATSTTNTSLRGLGFYATADDTWSYLVNNDSNAGTFSSGNGYTMKRATTGLVKFIGNLNTDDLGVDATISSAGNGFNLLGNPYTAFINSQTFLTDNTNIDQQIWVWDQTGGGNYEAKIAGAAFEIAPGQGFFVKANSGTAVNFAESNQSAQGTDTFLRINSWTEVKLLMTDGEKNRFTKLYFTDDATTGFDAGWEGEVFGGIQNEIDVFTHLVEESQGKKYQVQSLPLSDLESLIIPVGVTVEAGKTATFSIENTNVPSNINVYIEDKQDNSFTLLEADANFSFTPENNLDGIGRFYIHTTTSSLSAADFDTNNNISIYTSSKDNLRIVGVQDGTANIQLYNILGKEVLKDSFEGNGLNDIALPKLISGVYIVKIATETGTTNKKIIIQ